LSTDDAVNCRVSNHEDDIEECRDLGRPVAEEVTQDNLENKSQTMLLSGIRIVTYHRSVATLRSPYRHISC
jgi:hypothetical protein